MHFRVDGKNYSQKTNELKKNSHFLLEILDYLL